MEDLMKDNLSSYSTSTIEEIFENFKTSKKGLSEDEAKKRIALYGKNVISDKREVGIVLEFLSHFKSPLVIILLLAAIVSAYFGEATNSVIIAILVIVSVTLDFFEEHSASKAAEKLKERVTSTSMVIRAGKKKQIKTAQICVGDVIFLSSGDLIPADARIIEADDFFVNESALTGESFPREKNPDFVREDKENSSNFDNLVFLGSNVVSGTALAVVYHTGKETEFGKIAKDILKKDDKSEFELSIGKFGFFLMRIILFLVLFIFLFNTLINRNVLESFLFAIAIAVGITPELLPMIMSITMARGSIRMSKVGVIVKRLSSIPNFGSMDILCTDKTGTLTEDKITLVSYADIFGNSDDSVFLYTYLNSFYQTGIKNPLDKAVLGYRKTATESYKKNEEIPFDFVRKMMSIVVAGPEGKVLITKGAPEEVIARCTHYSSQKNKKDILSDDIRTAAMDYYMQLSSDGHRVLAIAKKVDLLPKEKYTHADESDLELIGFVAFLDPAKKGVKEVLVQLEERGIEIKVITGDNELVAKKICTDVGLKIKGILLGTDISALTDDALRMRAEHTTIFARFSPDEKNRIIMVLRNSGHVVGYLGDGINDAPSIKTADVGISVENAVDVAKESADIILTQKNLSSIVDGVGEGRRAFGNTMKYIMMGLSSNFGNMFSMTGAIFFLPFLPMLPVQILLNNLIYDFSQVTIPSDNVDREWIAKPRKWDLDFIKKFMYVFGPISSIFDFLTFFILFHMFKVGASAFQTGWFMESLATQTLVVHIIRTRQIPFLQSRASRFLIISTIAAVVVGWLIPFTFVGKIFQFSPLPIPILLTIIALVIIYLALVEIVKRVFYKKYGFVS
jgi:Mg2+-importing ATPase